MRVIRTVVWVLLLVMLLLFSLNNWQMVEVRIWNDLLLETRLPVLVLAAFLLGLLPMWLLAKAGKWRLTRRINALEAAVRNAVAPAPVPPIATSTQLEAAQAAASHPDPSTSENPA